MFLRHFRPLAFRSLVANLAIYSLLNFVLIQTAKGVSIDPKLLPSIANQMRAQAAAAGPLGARLLTAANTIQTLAPQYTTELEACQKEKLDTDTNCAESESKDLTQFFSMMGSLGNMAGMTMSGSCSKLAEMMKYGQGAMAAFRAQCLMVRTKCIDACKLANATAQKIKTALAAGNYVMVDNDPAPVPQTDEAYKAKLTVCTDPKNGKNPDEKQACIDKVEQEHNANLSPQNNNKQNSNGAAVNYIAQIEEAQRGLNSASDPNSAVSLLKACEFTAQEVTAKVGQNLQTLMSTMQSNQACAQQFQTFKNDALKFDDCNLTGTCVPKDPTSDCTKAEFKNNVYCLDYNTSTNGTATGTNTTGGGSGGDIGANTGLTGTLNGSLNGADIGGSVNGNSSDPGLFGGGRNGFGNLSGFGTNSDGKNFDPFDPNDPNNPYNKIQDNGGARSAGVPGGGGGGPPGVPGGGYNGGARGGGRNASGGDGTNVGPIPSHAGAGFGGGSGATGREDLRRYLPGGDKDPKNGKKGMGPDGITSSGGLTIFDKVKKSYINNRSSLLPE